MDTSPVVEILAFERGPIFDKWAVVFFALAIIAGLVLLVLALAKLFRALIAVAVVFLFLWWGSGEFLLLFVLALIVIGIAAFIMWLLRDERDPDTDEVDRKRARKPLVLGVCLLGCYFLCFIAITNGPRAHQAAVAFEKIQPEITLDAPVPADDRPVGSYVQADSSLRGPGDAPSVATYTWKVYKSSDKDCDPRLYPDNGPVCQPAFGTKEYENNPQPRIYFAEPGDYVVMMFVSDKERGTTSSAVASKPVTIPADPQSYKSEEKCTASWTMVNNGMTAIIVDTGGVPAAGSVPSRDEAIQIADQYVERIKTDPGKLAGAVQQYTPDSPPSPAALVDDNGCAEFLAASYAGSVKNYVAELIGPQDLLAAPEDDDSQSSDSGTGDSTDSGSGSGSSGSSSSGSSGGSSGSSSSQPAPSTVNAPVPVPQAPPPPVVVPVPQPPGNPLPQRPTDDPLDRGQDGASVPGPVPPRPPVGTIDPVPEHQNPGPADGAGGGPAFPTS